MLKEKIKQKWAPFFQTLYLAVNIFFVAPNVNAMKFIR